MTHDRSATLSFTALLEQRIVIFDGAMGTMIQRHRCSEAQFRGERFKDWRSDLRGRCPGGQLGAQPRAACPRTVRTAHRFARTGQGIAFLPRLPCIQSIKSGLLAAVQISDPVLNSGTFDIITLAARKLPLAAEEFINTARQELQRYSLRTAR